jgi:hypothetical protein
VNQLIGPPGEEYFRSLTSQRQESTISIDKENQPPLEIHHLPKKVELVVQDVALFELIPEVVRSYSGSCRV